MVKTKIKKSKPNKHPNAKKNGKQSDISEFRAQLDALGLKIIDVTADGNCFFRALADQLEGDEDVHAKYRKMVVQYIMKNRENFEPFIEDEVPFDEYCQSMEKDGTWAGNMELQAASLVTHSNICIHQKSSTRWYIKNFSDFDAKMVHLSYHDWEHYNSVRLKEDPCNGPATPIIIKADVDLSVKSHQTNAAVSKANGKSAKAESVRTVKAGSACEDERKIQQVLLQVDGDVDAAIEVIIAGQGTEESLVENDGVAYSVDDDSHGGSRNNQLEQSCDEKSVKEKPTCSNAERETNKTNSLHDEKVSRKYPETRLVHVVQRRNTSLVVVLQQEDRLQLQTTTVLKMESIEKIRNKGKKRETWWFRMVVMEVLLTWVHFAYEHHLPLISETKSRRRRSSSKDYIFRGMLFQIFLKSSWDCNNQVSLYLKCIIICLVVEILHVELH